MQWSSIPKWLRVIVMIPLILAALFHLADWLYPLDTKRLDKPESTRILDRNGHVMRIHLSEDGYLRLRMDRKALTDDVVETLLAYEDRYFFHHPGINLLSIVRAIGFNLRHQRTIGASTITMQLARMMHRQPRTVIHKLIEMFMALQLEYHYSKEEILLLYLNNAPYGGNIEGFSSAAYAYFGLPVDALSRAQIAYLIAIPKNPNRNRPKNIKRVQALTRQVLDRVYAAGMVSQEAYCRAKQEQLSPKRQPLPHFAPHLSAQLAGGGRFQTSIDLVLQQKVQTLVTQGVKRLKPLGIHNGAAIVIDNKTMQILAYVGSQGFNDKRYGGQVDGVRALISPGSTLKPFIYAKAMENGLITPLKKLFDVPLSLAGYKPLNYSERYLGEVTAKEALQFSLNIPAVELDRLLEEDSLYRLLTQARIPSINRPKDYYGSALVLGGCGVSLKELAQLFAALANGGKYKGAHYLLNETDQRSIRLLRPESAYLVSTILADAPRKRFSSSWAYLKDIPMVAFKTGTSAHAKDLLSIGYTPEYTVAVWYGNFDRKKSRKKPGKNKRTSGLEAASPTLFEILKLLRPSGWFVQPKGVVNRLICQDALVTGPCKSEVMDSVIVDVTPAIECKRMRAEVLAKLMQNGTIRSMDDLVDHPCIAEWRTYRPLITNPIDQRNYLRNRALPEHLKKMALQCYSFESNTTLYWLIDSEPPFMSRSAQTHHRYLAPGTHQIRCLDSGAKMHEITITIEEP